MLEGIIMGRANAGNDEVDHALQTDKYADAVRADEKEAEELRLEYVPFFRFRDGKVLQGVASAGALRQALISQ